MGRNASVVTAEVKPVSPDKARDAALVEELAHLINEAYAVGEAGLWLDGTTRTGPAEIAEAIRSSRMLAATFEGQLVGCAYVRPLDAGTADLGMVAAAPDQWGRGVGRELVRSAEELMRSNGVATMQLELLVPKGWVHPGEGAPPRLVHPRLSGDPVGAVRGSGGAPCVPTRRAVRVPHLRQAAALTRRPDQDPNLGPTP